MGSLVVWKGRTATRFFGLAYVDSEALNESLDQIDTVLETISKTPGPPGPPALPAGPTTAVQFNDAGMLGGNAGFTYDPSDNNLTITNANLAMFSGALLMHGGAINTGDGPIDAGAGAIAGASGVVGGVQLGTTAPGVVGPTLQGEIDFAAFPITLVDGPNNDIPHSTTTWLPLLGGGASATITGFDNSPEIAIGLTSFYLIVYNQTGSNVVFKEDDSASLVGNRLTMAAGVDKTVAPKHSVRFIYDQGTSHWLEIAA